MDLRAITGTAWSGPQRIQRGLSEFDHCLNLLVGGVIRF